MPEGTLMKKINGLIILARIFQCTGFGTILFFLMPLVINLIQIQQRRSWLMLLYEIIFIFSMFYAASKILKSLEKPKPVGLIFLSIFFITFSLQFTYIAFDAIAPYSDELTQPQFFYRKDFH